MRPEHLDHLRSAGAPSLTPDGSLAVVAVSRPDTTADRYRSALWVVPTDGSSARRLTAGPGDSAPAVSPDGRWVAFLRAPQKGAPQVAVVPRDGGEPLVLTDQRAGAGAPRWSPDGTRVVWSARVPEQGRYGTDEEVGPEAEPPRLVTTNSYRLDGVGYTGDRPQHLFVLDLADLLGAVDRPDADPPELPLTAHQVTDGDHDDTAPAWSPDGRWIAFVSDRHDGHDDDLRSDVYRVSVDGGEVHAVTRGDLAVDQVEWPQDSRLVLVAGDVGPDGTDFVGAQSGVWRVDLPADASGPVEAVRLTDAERYDLGEPGSRLVVAGDDVLLVSRNRGAADLLRLPLDAGPGTDPEVVSAGRRLLRGVDATADGSTVVAVVADPDRVGDLAVVRDDDLRLLTDLSSGLPDPVSPLQERVATAPDGYEVHGWVLLPDADRFGEGPHPVLLNVHGGPFAQYGWGLFDEAQVYTGAGYAVVMCNPRGAAGYGSAHGRAVKDAFGTVDADDVLAFLDDALTDGSLRLDADRVGVMGGSYGGYMTALLTTRTDRFVAAVVERAYLDPETFAGASDIGWFFPWQYHGSVANMHEQAPMTHVANVTTPTLVIHSEADWRCPVDQGQRWYAALRRQGVEAELLLFPGEGHELTRSGRPKHRLARFEHILRWWGRHLPVTPAEG